MSRRADLIGAVPHERDCPQHVFAGTIPARSADDLLAAISANGLGYVRGKRMGDRCAVFTLNGTEYSDTMELNEEAAETKRRLCVLRQDETAYLRPHTA